MDGGPTAEVEEEFLLEEKTNSYSFKTGKKGVSGGASQLRV